MVVKNEDIPRIRELASRHIPYLQIGIQYTVPKRTIRKVINGEWRLKPRKRLYLRQDGACVGCKRSIPFEYSSIDHIIPKSKGGKSIYENYQVLCRYCNVLKGDRDMEYLLSRIRNKPLEELEQKNMNRSRNKKKKGH